MDAVWNPKPVSSEVLRETMKLVGLHRVTGACVVGVSAKAASAATRVLDSAAVDLDISGFKFLLGTA